MPQVYILLLNYNGWEDTIECLESLARLNSISYQIIVVDNCSPNHSLFYIKEWAYGRINVWLNKTHPLKDLSFPPFNKPIPFVEYSQQEIEQGTFKLHNSPLVFIQANKNAGYAAGNNIGLKYILAHENFEHVWLLNNDTVVEQESLNYLLDKAKKLKQKGLHIGIIGAKILYYHRPDVLQCAGGYRYNKWLALVRSVGGMQKDAGQFDKPQPAIDFITGASMFVDKEFIQQVGLLSENYFLYFEEPDWIERGRKYKYTIDYDWRVKVFHKEGAAIGAGGRMRKQENSRLSDFYTIRNRLLFTKKFYSFFCLSTVYITILIAFFNRIRRKQFDRLFMIIQIVRNPNKKHFQ